MMKAILLLLSYWLCTCQSQSLSNHMAWALGVIPEVSGPKVSGTVVSNDRWYSFRYSQDYLSTVSTVSSQYSLITSTKIPQIYSQEYSRSSGRPEKHSGYSLIHQQSIPRESSYSHYQPFLSSLSGHPLSGLSGYSQQQFSLSSQSMPQYSFALSHTNIVSSNTITPSPSTEPTAMPSVEPSAVPSAVPSAMPSAMPSAEPSVSPTYPPSEAPSVEPSYVPSHAPSAMPVTMAPSFAPTQIPTFSPSLLSGKPSLQPTKTPTLAPTSTFTVVVVQVTTSLAGLTVAQFDTSAQTAFKESLVKVLPEGLSAKDINITAIIEVDLRRRRLLAALDEASSLASPSLRSESVRPDLSDKQLVVSSQGLHPSIQATGIQVIWALLAAMESIGFSSPAALVSAVTTTLKESVDSGTLVQALKDASPDVFASVSANLTVTGFTSYIGGPPPTQQPTPVPSSVHSRTTKDPNLGIYIGVGVGGGVLLSAVALFAWWFTRKSMKPVGVVGGLGTSAVLPDPSPAAPGRPGGAAVRPSVGGNQVAPMSVAFAPTNATPNKVMPDNRAVARADDMMNTNAVNIVSASAVGVSGNRVVRNVNA